MSEKTKTCAQKEKQPEAGLPACQSKGFTMTYSTSITCSLEAEDAASGKRAAQRPFAAVLPLNPHKSFLGKREAAAGLAWTRAEPGKTPAEQAELLNESDAAPEEAEDSAERRGGFRQPYEQERTSAGCLYDSGIIIEDRAGFVRLKALPHGAGPVCSLAALLLETKSQGIEVWELPPSYTKRRSPCWWVWAARLGRLSARADKVFDSLEEAMHLADDLKESLGLEEIGIVYAAGVKEELAALDALPAKTFAKAKLHPLRLLSSWPVRLAFLAALLAAVLAIAYAAAPQMFPFQAGKPAKSAQQLQADKKAADIRAHPERFFPSAWLKAPAPKDSLLHMMPGILETPLAANGWTLEELTATGREIATSWKASGAASMLLPPKGAAWSAGKAASATSVHPLSDLKREAPRKWQDIAAKEEITPVLAELAARFNLKMQISWKKAQTMRVGEETVSCPWIVGRLTYSQVPGSIFADFASFALALADQRTAKSLVLSSISWKNGQWTITGEIYAKP